MPRLAHHQRRCARALLLAVLACVAVATAPAASALPGERPGIVHPVSIGLSPEGGTVFVLQVQGWVVLRRDPASGALRHLGSGSPRKELAGSQSNRAFVIAPDGRDVYFTTFDRPGVIRRVAVSGDRAVEVDAIPLPTTWQEDPVDAGRQFLMHPDGVHLLVERSGVLVGQQLEGSTLVFARRADGGLDLRSEHASRWGSLGTFSADGSTLLSWHGARSWPPTTPAWSHVPHSWGYETSSNGMGAFAPGGRLAIGAEHLARRAGDAHWEAVAELPREPVSWRPAALQFSDDGRFVYTSSNLSSAGALDVVLQAWRIDEAAGSLALVQQRMATEACRDATRACDPSADGEHLSAPRGFVISPDGRHAYVVDRVTAASRWGINQYDRDPDAGTLAFRSWWDERSLDRSPPEVASAFARLDPGGAAHTVVVDATDDLSGVTDAQLTRNPARPGTWRSGSTIRRPGSTLPEFVRMRDAAGNASPWRLIPAPRLAATVGTPGTADGRCGTPSRPCEVARGSSIVTRVRPTAHRAFLDGSTVQVRLERRGPRGWSQLARTRSTLRRGIATARFEAPRRLGRLRIVAELPARPEHPASAPTSLLLRVR